MTPLIRGNAQLRSRVNTMRMSCEGGSTSTHKFRLRLETLIDGGLGNRLYKRIRTERAQPRDLGLAPIGGNHVVYVFAYRLHQHAGA